MKQRLVFLISFLVLLVLLVGLNAASYVQKEKPRDSEDTPNRSTFNNGATGTSALYALLSETGQNVRRWQDPLTYLSNGHDRPSVLVLAGPFKQEVTSVEAESLQRWVSEGGRLVLIDRAPPSSLMTTSSNWRVSIDEHFDYRVFSTDPSDKQQMTANVSSVTPIQPSRLTDGVAAVQPSLFASSISIEPLTSSQQISDGDKGYVMPSVVVELSDIAPLSVVGTGKRTLVAVAPFGAGDIVFVADPYLVANGGIDLADNARLAVNVVSREQGPIAFDEYHHGYGSDRNRFLEFFAGTPVIAIFLQVVVLIAAGFYSQSRRFGRPLPVGEPERLSKLEYISAMAQLQQRARAYDLAIENVYGEFHRRVTRLLGLDTLHAGPDEVALEIAGRTDLNAAEVRQMLTSCREIVRGEPTSARETTELISRIREFERKLGLSRSRSAVE